MVKRRKVYDLWMEYEKFLRSLHLETLEKKSSYDIRKRFFNYLKRLPIILIGSLLTTLTFQFFINPNGLFNSGLSGIIQVVVNYFFTKNGVSIENRAVGYYGVVVLVNVLIVSIVQFFYPYNLEVNSTAIFYVLFQFMWSAVFRYFSLQSYFSRFSARSWSSLSSLNQLGLTLPFYIIIGIVSAVIHTYGYSLIYQAKSTPGGFEILTSTLAQNKKNKASIGSLNKSFSLFVIFFITVFNFFIVSDNSELKTNQLIDLINNNNNVFAIEGQRKIEDKQQLSKFLEQLDKEDYYSVKSFNVRKLLADWSGDNFFIFEKLPQKIQTYLRTDKEILEALHQLEIDQREKVDSLSEEIALINRSDPTGEMIFENKTKHHQEILSSLSHIKARINEIKRNSYEKNLFGYFEYITNDEKLWASLIYILLSSYLINQIFPKSRIVLLTIFLENDISLGETLSILQNYNPSYLRVLAREDEKEQEHYLLFCSITKWNYQLLANEISKFGKVLVNTLDE